MQIRPIALSVLTALAFGAGACGGGHSTAQPVIDTGDGGHYSVTLDPARFVDVIDNPYLPLRRGSRWTYEQGDHSKVVVQVTDAKKTILGIPATVVRDTLTDPHGDVTEDTFDWYGQDRDGNVWYLGEDTKELRHGAVTSTEGSWEAGIDHAQPGIAMLARPRVGKAYRQEFHAGDAEDLAIVRHAGGRATVPLGTYDDVLLTREWTRLEPKVIEEKQYAPGIGNISTTTVAGGNETERLIEFKPGR